MEHEVVAEKSAVRTTPGPTDDSHQAMVGQIQGPDGFSQKSKRLAGRFYLDDCKIRKVFQSFDSTGLYRIDIVGDVRTPTDDRYSMDKEVRSLAEEEEALTRYLTSRYGKAHYEYKLPPRIQLQEGMSYQVRSWHVGEKKSIVLSYVNEHGSIFVLMEIYLRENDMRAKRQRRAKESDNTPT